MSLEEYLAEEYEANRADIAELELTLQAASRTFQRSFRRLPNAAGKHGYWDYELRPNERSKLKPLKDISQGTVAMVLAALGKLTGYDRAWLDEQSVVPGDYKALRKLWNKGAETLVLVIGKKQQVFSGSFGANDPITISHIAEVLRGVGAPEALANGGGDKGPAKVTVARLRNLLKTPFTGASAVAELQKLWKSGPLRTNKLLPGLNSEYKTYLRNTFVPLRVIRSWWLLRKAEIIREGGTKPRDFQPFFEGTVHHQLSFSSIQDSRFDAAELMFGLEGLVLLAPTAVEAHLFARILEVLELKQKESAHWRPSKPIFATQQGMTMLPISVEGVNSLLRAFAILCEHRHGEFAGFGGRCVTMVRRFWQWLHARIVEFPGYSGWHSEHVNDPELVHTWDTSQVIEFMLGYRSLLQRDIAHRALSLSRVKVWLPEPAKTWDKVVLEREAATRLGREYEVYRRLGEEFIRPREAGAPFTNYSALLYGPPGTGKTSLARNLADALKIPLLSLSVSDFLGGGGAMVEARAKAIFRMLEAQEDCVIFFDEIDSFLLDRNSQHYRDQDTLFQFLTPGMLTKINDLRQAARSIFLIAANYENRIDPAIKRPGRIDQKYLLLPPDKAKREAILLDRDVRPAVARDPAIVRASLFMGYSEILGAVTKAKNRKATVTTLSAALKEVGASTGPEAYGRRVFIENTYPCEEAACLYLLAKEAGIEPDFETRFREAAGRVGAATPITSGRSPDERIKLAWTDIMAWVEKIQEMGARG